MKVIEVDFGARNSFDAGKIIADALNKLFPCEFIGAKTETYDTVRYGKVTSSDFKPFFIKVPNVVKEIRVIVLEGGHGESVGGSEWAQGQATFRIAVYYINGSKKVIDLPVKYGEVDYRRRWYQQ
jgi:hypothetical protein